MKSVMPVLILTAGLAACSSGSLDSNSQTTASVSDPDDKSASTGFTESDRYAMRPETERSREVLWRLKGRTIQNQLRR